MKTFFADIIPKIQKYSQKLDNLTLLTNNHWVIISEIENSKNVYIFRSGNELLISQNGKVEKAKWEYIGNNSILIERKEETYLFKHGFFDENILALKIDGKNEYAFLINENKYEGELNSLENVLDFLNKKYIEPQIINDLKKTTGIEIDNKSNCIKLNSYNSPKYKITKLNINRPIFSNANEEYLIEYDDNNKGKIFLVINSKRAYFKDSETSFLPRMIYFENFDYCVNALHYYLTTSKILYEGYIATYN